MKLSKEELILVYSALNIAAQSPDVQPSHVKDIVDLTIRVRQEIETVTEAELAERIRVAKGLPVDPAQKRMEAALRVLDVFEANRENLDYISSAKQKYNTVNRNVMTRTIRKFTYDMTVALQGDPEVGKENVDGKAVGTPRESKEGEDSLKG